MGLPNDGTSTYGTYIEEEAKFYVIGSVDAFKKYKVASMVRDKSEKVCLEVIVIEICLKFGVLKYTFID